MIPDQKITVAWSPTNIKHYKELGYIFTKHGDNIEIDIKHLSKKSHIKVYYICDFCFGENQNSQNDKTKSYHYLTADNLHCCNHRQCRSTKVSNAKRNKEICIKDSFGYNFPQYIQMWSPHNKKSPFEYKSYSNIRVSWICKNGHTFTKTITEMASGKTRCIECCSIANNFPHLLEEWHPHKNKNLSPYKVSHASNRLCWWRCKNIECKHEWESTPANRRTRGCPNCATFGFKINEPGTLYLTRWYNNNFEFLKVGITKNTEIRQKQQKRKTNYTPELLHEYHFNHGKDALDLETKILRSFEFGKIVTKEDFPYGHTETTSINNLQPILNIIQESI